MMSEDGHMDASDDHAITVKVVKLYDGSPGYMLANGMVITPEAWNNLEPEFLRSLVNRAPVNGPASPNDDEEKPE